MRLTTNFDSSEFDAASSGGTFPAQYAANRAALASILQWLRDIAGSYGRITSAYRSPERNAAVGGVETSQHMDGEAADVIFPLASMRAMATQVLHDMASGAAPHFGQIIFYTDKGHVHVSLPTLGSRNGEVRYSFMADGQRMYPFLNGPALAQLPTIAAGTAVAAVSRGTVVVFLLAAAIALASCAQAWAQSATVVQSQSGSGPTWATAFGYIATALSALTLAIIKDVRDTLKEMKTKVDVLWDRSERGEMIRPRDPQDVGAYKP